VGVCVLLIISFGYVKSELSRYGFDDTGRQWAMDMYGLVQKYSRILNPVHLDLLE